MRCVMLYLEARKAADAASHALTTCTSDSNCFLDSSGDIASWVQKCKCHDEALAIAMQVGIC